MTLKLQTSRSWWQSGVIPEIRTRDTRTKPFYTTVYYHLGLLMLQKMLLWLRNFWTGYFIKRFIKFIQKKIDKNIYRTATRNCMPFNPPFFNRLGNISKRNFCDTAEGQIYQEIEHWFCLVQVKLGLQRSTSWVFDRFNTVTAKGTQYVKLGRKYEIIFHRFGISYSQNKNGILCRSILWKYRREGSDINSDNRRWYQKIYFFISGNVEKLELHYIYTYNTIYVYM